jgi:hypothetical protein
VQVNHDLPPPAANHVFITRFPEFSSILSRSHRLVFLGVCSAWLPRPCLTTVLSSSRGSRVPQPDIPVHMWENVQTTITGRRLGQSRADRPLALHDSRNFKIRNIEDAVSGRFDFRKLTSEACFHRRRLRFVKGSLAKGRFELQTEPEGLPH